jgi:hypothetical protein
MFDWIALPIWTRSGGGVETINQPGEYIFYVIVPVPDQLIGTSFKIPLTDWRVTVNKIKDWGKGSKVYVQIDNDKAAIKEAKLSPLQIDALLGIGLLAAFALLVDRISKVSPVLTFLVYGTILVVLISLYVRYGHPWLKAKMK